MDYCAGKQLL